MGRTAKAKGRGAAAKTSTSRKKQKVDPLSLDRERLMAAARCLVGAAGAIDALRRTQLAYAELEQVPESTPQRRPPQTTATDRTIASELKQAVRLLENVAALQAKQRKRVAMVRLREQILEAYRRYGETPRQFEHVSTGPQSDNYLEIATQRALSSRKPVLSFGMAGADHFHTDEVTSLEGHVAQGLKQAWEIFRILLDGDSLDLDTEPPFELLASARYVADPGHEGLVKAATRSSVIMADLGAVPFFFEDEDQDEGSGRTGSASDQEARNGHYTRALHASDVFNKTVQKAKGIGIKHTIHLDLAPSEGDTGTFFGVDAFQAEQAILSFAREAFGHLPGVAAAECEGPHGRDRRELRPDVCRMSKGQVWRSGDSGMMAADALPPGDED